MTSGLAYTGGLQPTFIEPSTIETIYQKHLEAENPCALARG
jgi:hypothetical protein